MEKARREADIRRRYESIHRSLDERQRRLWVAVESRADFAGLTLVHRATGLARSTIRRGLAELDSGVSPGVGRVRRSGAGRRKAEVVQPGLKAALDAMVEPTARGDPESPLRWTCKGVRRLAAALLAQGFAVGRQKVAELLADLGYSLQGNRKTLEGSKHPDRNAQFEHITRTVSEGVHRSEGLHRSEGAEHVAACGDTGRRALRRSNLEDSSWLVHQLWPTGSLVRRQS